MHKLFPSSSSTYLSPVLPTITPVEIVTEYQTEEGTTKILSDFHTINILKLVVAPKWKRGKYQSMYVETNRPGFECKQLHNCPDYTILEKILGKSAAWSVEKAGPVVVRTVSSTSQVIRGEANK